MIVIFSSFSMAAYPQQEIEYSLFYQDKVIGEQRVSISYLPSNLEQPLGGRIIEVYTEINEDASKLGGYAQRSTAHFSGKQIKFVSASNKNNEKRELQGRLLNNEKWLVHDIQSDNTSVHEYSLSELELPSIAFYDPVLSQLLLEKSNTSIYFIEHGILVDGVWNSKGEEKHKVSRKKIVGERYKFSSNVAYEGVWSDTGLLLSWKMPYDEIIIEAKVRSLPEKPDFGTIESIKSFEGVQEEEL